MLGAVLAQQVWEGQPPSCVYWPETDEKEVCGGVWSAALLQRRAGAVGLVGSAERLAGQLRLIRERESSARNKAAEKLYKQSGEKKTL